MNHLSIVLQVFKEHQLFYIYRKCEYRLRSVTFLVHIIFSEGVEVYQRKIEVVKKWLSPLTPIDIRSFLGLTGNYRRFVEGFASIESPLTFSTQKRMKFEWLEACERSFYMLK